jgi:hypothetical protein
VIQGTQLNEIWLCVVILVSVIKRETVGQARLDGKVQKDRILHCVNVNPAVTGMNSVQAQSDVGKVLHLFRTLSFCFSSQPTVRGCHGSVNKDNEVLLL